MKKALIVYGGWKGHDPEGVSALFTDILKEEGFEVTLSDTLDAFLEDLTVYDLLIPVWTMGEITNEQVKHVWDAVAAGTGIAGCHGGMCDSFRTNTNWQFITGAQWVAHPGNSEAHYRVNIKKSASDPIVEGIEDFDVTSEQYYIHVDPAIQVLASTRFPVIDGPHAANGEVDVPVVFTKRFGKGKVFYNSLGHTSAVFAIPEAKELMRRGFLWAAR